MKAVYVPPHYVILIGDWVINFTFWTMIAFFAIATAVWPWWKSFWGWNIVTLELAIGLALLPGILAIDFGINRFMSLGAAWIQIFAVFLAGCIVLWRGALVLNDQLRGAEVTPVQLVMAFARSAARRLRSPRKR